MESSLLKKNLHKLIDHIEDVEILAAVYQILAEKQEPDWWNSISNDAKKAIEEGLADIKAGRVQPHESVLKEVQELIK